ncbi:MAG: hypothetical protein C4532_01450 [Candidatus Abyssobacteria bacterium SURF_17]|uniref:Glycerophosphoryl diester phosphodiesterase membrane domain-containing protein n=1 Tax=Candidatus Abyssobacteria bacterium SURF_17 TaxID=2093361 RepID=A0A419F8V5_9BACT|nr:MAG: hypothetical protein C4532_01450 [Candidatus Abyssubacteria bacterium SURF_17]
MILLANIEHPTLNPVEIFRVSWKIFKDRLKTILAIAFSISFPVYVLFSFISTYIIIPEEGPAAKIARITLSGLQWMVVSLIDVLAVMAIAYVADGALKGETVRYRSALGKSLSKWRGAVWAVLLWQLAAIGGALLLVLPGVAYFIYYSFCSLSVALRDQSGRAALDYSKFTVEGRWWDAFGFFACKMLIWIGIMIPYITLYMAMRRVNMHLSFVFGSAISSFVGAYLTTATAVFFLNLECLKALHADEPVLKHPDEGIVSVGAFVLAVALLIVSLVVGPPERGSGFTHRDALFAAFICVSTLLPFFGLGAGILGLAKKDKKQTLPIVGIALNGIICVPCVVGILVVIIKSIIGS